MTPVLSSSQLPLWLGQRLAPQSPLYNMAFVVLIEGAVDPARFQAAWRAVVEQQPSLRTSFLEQGGSPCRAVRPPESAAETSVLDFSTSADPAAAFRAWAEQRCAHPLSLEGALVESAIARLGADRFGWYLNEHHLVTDAASSILLCRAVAAAYACLDRGEVVTPAAIGLADPGIEETTIHAADVNDEASAAYWRERAAASTSTEFYGRCVAPSSTAATRHFIHFDFEQAKRFREACREDGFGGLFTDMSLFTGWATVLLAWLRRISGQTSLSFVTPSANRPSAAARKMLGVFIEMFPFGAEINPGETFRSLGRKCGAELRAWLRHAGPGRAPTETVAANVVLNFRSGDIGDFAGTPWRVEWIHSGHADAAHPVRLQVYDFEGRGAFRIALDLNNEAFPSATRARAAAHFENVLAAFLSDRDQAIDAIEVLSPEERRVQLEAFNAPAAAPLPQRTVLDLFREQARRTPDAIALREGARELNFALLAERSDAVAAALISDGVKPGDLVAIHARRSIDTVVAILGVLAARAAYVPIDASYPPERVRQILEGSGASLLLADASLAVRAPGGSWTMRGLDVFVAGAGTRPSVSAGPVMDDRAYVIFTSGSTGTPKGVPITHAGLADYLTWAEREYVRGNRLAFALFTSLAFDLTVTSLFLPLITGGSLAIYSDGEGPVDDAFLAMMRDNAADIIKLTPSHLQLMRQFDLTRSRVQRMIVGGEDLKGALTGAIAKQFGRDVEIYNEYGPTEAVVGCMIHRFDPATDATRASVPIGRPADHVQLYVVNDALQLVPEGTPGELCIARHGLAAGYHGDAKLTAERFVANPWKSGRRIYRTGDLVRFIRADCLDFLGRIDRQVKISGHRVELREIEHAIARHPAVENVVAWISPAIATDAAASQPSHRCVRCGLPSNYPGATFDDAGVCNLCHSYDAIKESSRSWFRASDELRARILAKRAGNRSGYDCLLLFSGGKDSTYALSRLVEMGLRVHAFTLDNGFLSDEAKTNIRRVVEALRVSHEFGSTPAMNAIFKDSLERFSNVCNGCYKTIYTLGINRARALGVPVVITGLSRGQFFETRLTPELFRGGRFTPEEVDRATLEARKVYHRADDAVHRLLDVSAFADDRIFEEVEILDFYRFVDVSLDEMLAHLDRTLPWVRPSDTGRSTNCLINDVGIHIHKRERGFHNYALPYSWDVRLGHKTRDEAIEELDDAIDLDRVKRILRTIDYDENRLTAARSQPQVVAFYVARPRVEVESLRRHAAEHLPRAMIPNRWIAIEAVPLTSNGKIDTRALAELWSQSAGELDTPSGPPIEGPVQERVANVWTEILGRRVRSADDNFFGLGGNSLAALEVMLRLCREFDLEFALPTIFQHPTVAALAAVIEQALLAEVEGLTEDEARRMVAEESS